MQASGETLVFPWPDDRRKLYDVFHAIQHAAGISLPCIRQDSHTCTDACGRYSFHDLRRSFATWNYGRLSIEQLQYLMRHKSRSTTESYVGYAKRARPEVVDLFIPPVGVNQ
jgi:integrase